MNNIKDVVAKIEKRFGKEAIAGKQDNIKFLDSGSIKLNKALGGGWAKGRIVEVYGWESSGKSTLALHAAANCQKEGKIVVYIDAEHALDETYANALGVDTSEKGGLWYLVQPSCGEEGLEIAMEFARCGEVGIIIVDSTSALIPKSIIDGAAGDAKMAVLARLMSQMIPKFINPALESGVVIFFINQLREKVGIVFGNPETTQGGNALKFYASQRVKIAKSGTGKDKEDNFISIGAKCKVEKNKVAPPLKVCKFDIAFGKGIDKLGEIIDIAEEAGVIEKKGSWYSYSESKLGQGRESVVKILEDNPELVEEIKMKIELI